jgi:site-specific DNA-methyltransferase (adenine-specific)
MPLLNRAQITVGPRQRTEIEKRPLTDLMESIRNPNIGLMTPIVVRKAADGSLSLVAGGRRLAALSALAADGVSSYRYSIGPAVPIDSVPAVVVAEDSIANLLEMEFVENDQREPLPWQDRCHAIAAIAAARKAEGARAPQGSLAQETFERLGGVESSPATLGTIRGQITQAVHVAAVLKDRPDLQKAGSADAAYQILLKERQEALEAEKMRRRLLKARAQDRLWDLRRGDSRELLLTLPDAEVDLVLTDPPYGIDIDKEAYAPGLRHTYSDDESYARELSIFIIQESWRLTKAKANLFMFCSWKSFDILHQAAAQYGWTPLQHPLIWDKGPGGHSPWGDRGFRYEYEVLLFATKGQLGVRGPLPDVLRGFNKVGSRAKIHGAEKPIELLQFLIDKSSLPHDLILDPCAGSGSTIVAASGVNRRSIGIEMDETYYNRAMSRLMHKDEQEPTE